jgi:hypothetical protein
MLRLLADVHCDLHVQSLLRVCRSDAWRDYWFSLGVKIHTFESLGIDRRLRDRDLWEYCQRHDIFLITANRNADGADSLQVTLLQRTTLNTLPVLTIGDPQLVLTDAEYAARAAVRMMEILTDVNGVRGTGRMFLPADAEM